MAQKCWIVKQGESLYLVEKGSQSVYSSDENAAIRFTLKEAAESEAKKVGGDFTVHAVEL